MPHSGVRALRNQMAGSVAVKGAVLVRWGTWKNSDRCIHLLDWLQGQLKQVSRATFTSEALACMNAVDQMIVLAFLMHQLSEGTISIGQARKLTDGRGNVYETGVSTEAMSVLSVFEPVNLPQPAERVFLRN